MIRPLGVRKLAGVLVAVAAVLVLGSCGDDPVTPPPPALTAQITGNSVHLSWAGISNPSFKLLRRLNVPPTGPADGAAAVVHAGTGNAADDPLPGLLPNPRRRHASTTTRSSGATLRATSATPSPTAPRSPQPSFNACELAATRSTSGTGQPTSAPTIRSSARPVRRPLQTVEELRYGLSERHGAPDQSVGRAQAVTSATTSAPAAFRSGRVLRASIAAV